MSDKGIRGALDKVWERSRDTALARVAILANAATWLASNDLSEDLRREAEREAHKLAGAVGTFGFWHASALAREAENLLQGTAVITPPDARRLAVIATELREQFLDANVGREAAKAAATPPSARVLLISNDADFRQRLSVDSRSLGIEIIGIETQAAARARLAGPVDAVLLDLTLEGFGLSFLEEIHIGFPNVRVIVLSNDDQFVDRVQAARLGGRGFLQKPVRPSQVIDLLRDSLIVPGIDQPSIVAVDDDPHMLSLIGTLLQPLGARVVTVTDPTAILPVLAETGPDLVILDVDMPKVDGIELCRVLRNDPRWASVPVLFLTSQTDPSAVTRMFEVGADDFVAKPVHGPELVARVRNRLERTRMLRLAADVDSLTGVATRRRGIEVIERFFKLAQRQRLPFSIAAIDLDRFKQVNDQFGHSMGDTVLRRAASILAGCFRGEDVVARWGGEEFVIGMYTMPREAAHRRLEHALAKLHEERFETRDGPLSVTFSAGVAEFPRDGSDWSALYHVADELLGRAKAQGRNRVLAADG